jgi:uncharacterized protein (DUF342 family)
MNERVTVPVTANKDGRIIVSFRDNDMEAWADFLPPYGGGVPITGDYIKTLLLRLNIVYDIRHEDIEKAALAANLSKRSRTKVLIAEGMPPVPACPAYYLKNKYLENAPPAASDKEQADYRKFSPFVIVKKGQILARMIPETVGKPGTNVHGEAIPYGQRTPLNLLPGENTYCEGDYMYASVAGQLLDQNGVISVSNTLVIKGDVNYATGNIHFPGDVQINGSAADGFKVYAGGNLLITQTFNATDVISKGNTEVRGGIIGRGQATVKAGGELKAKFIENCRVAARGNITVSAEILNSSVYTMGMLNVSDRGLIMGVEVYALHGMKCAKIGKTAGNACKIHVGIDFAIQKEIEKAVTQLRLFNVKLEKLKALISAAGNTSGERYKKMIELRNSLDAEIGRLSAVIDSLQAKVIVDENAMVVVQDEISPGTLIEICQVALFVDKTLRRVILRLDKAQGKIVSTT